LGLHISRIEIKNFRNFQHLVIDNFPAHAVIVGENGVGKSNLLEAIRLVLDPSLPDAPRGSEHALLSSSLNDLEAQLNQLSVFPGGVD